MLSKVVIFVVLCIFCATSSAHHSKILLRTATIDTTTQPSLSQSYDSITQRLLTYILQFPPVKQKDNEEISSYLFRYRKGMMQIAKEKLQNMGIKLGGYVPYDTIIGSATPSQVRNAQMVNEIEWIGELKDHHKMHEEQQIRNWAKVHKFVENVLDNSSPRTIMNGTELLYIVNVVVAHHGSKHELEQVTKEWSKELKTEVGWNFKRLIVSSPQKIVLGIVGSESAIKVAKLLTKKGIVHWVEIKPPTKTQNRYASQLLQSYSDPASRPLTQRGLNGEGQIVGIADTGIDVYHCFFYDDSTDVPYQRNRMDNNPDKGHRKIAAYWAYMDKIDTAGGHGTHVAASACGEAHTVLSPNKLSEHNSLAYKSRIAFLDAGCDTKDGCTCPADTECECSLKEDKKCEAKLGAVYLPIDLNAGWFPWFYEKGVRVQSNSWGTGYFKDHNFGYSVSTQEIDRFAWEHKDFLPIFAAGNSGQLLGYFSLTSESESKNALVVGASQTTIDGFKAAIDFADFEKLADRVKVDLVEMYCSRSSGNYDKDLCNAAKEFNAEKCCDEKVDGKNACEGKDIKDCCGNQLFAEEMKNTIGFKCCPKCIKYDMETYPTHFRETNLGQFTARGPTLDGRIKPDIVAPGDVILSANSQGTDPDNKCSDSQTFSKLMMSRQGTSMAAPVAASAALVVRQFYSQGWYPSGFPRKADAFQPSAALVKATLIHSAEQLDGSIYMPTKQEWFNLQYRQGTKYSLKSPLFQGFGRIELNNVLGYNSTLYLPNGGKDRDITTGEVHKYCVFVKNFTRPFKITLVWTDPPSTPNALINLVNDLDLRAISSNGLTYFGNGVRSTYQSSRSEPDYRNNIEQLVFTKEDPIGVYTIVVQGSNVPVSPQPYALIFTGTFERVPDNRCPHVEFLTPFANQQKLMIFRLLSIIFGMTFAVLFPIVCSCLLFAFVRYRRVVTENLEQAQTTETVSQLDDDSEYRKISDIIQSDN